MKYTKLFTKTLKTSKKYDTVNATYLIKGGFIDQTMAGVYTFLPLGLKVLNKIERIIREEMDKIGNEIFMPSLAPKEFLEKTGRIEKIDVQFEARGGNDASRKLNDATYSLNSTHEDLVTPLVQKFNRSYKDFPFAVYQIQTKFRNEARPKSGLLRGREFRMKDLYSFHTSEEDFKKYYNESKKYYMNVFERVGLGEDTVIALASGGSFTDDYSHEFQAFCESGEDVIFYDESNKVYYNREVTPAKAPEVTYKDSDMKEMEDVLGEGIIGVEELASFLNIEVERTTKTLLYKSENGFVAAAVRGGYDVDEGKLKKILKVKQLQMATPDEVKEVTGTVVGYVGILNLPKNVTVVVDESCDNRLNFEMGANRENYHTLNVNWDRDIQKPEKFYDIKVAKETDLNPETGKKYKTHKVSEVGNIFPLQTKFPDSFDYRFTDESGKEKQIYMGSYGIGSSRLMGVIVEKFHDENGIMWPKNIAPFQVHLISLGKENDDAVKLAENIYDEMEKRGVEVLWDDRDVNAGEKFTDADLVGIPLRVVISKKTLESNSVEIKKRDSGDSELIKIEELIDRIKSEYLS